MNRAPQPWETPFDGVDEVAQVPVVHLIGGVNWNAQVRSSPLGSGGGFYLWRDGEAAGFWAMHLNSILEASSSNENVQSVGVRALDRGNLARVFLLDANGELRREGIAPASCLWIRADGTGGWNPNWNTFAHGKDQFVLFRWRKSQGFATFTLRRFDDVWREFQSARSDPNSDVSFALAWADLSETERENLLYLWPPHNQVLFKLQLEGCLIDALLSDESLWQHDGADWILNVKTRDDVALFRFETYLQRQSEPISEQLTRAVETIWSRFDPFDEAVLTHLCARRWRELNYRYFQGRAKTPTMHERLEGMMRWRDWENHK